MEIDARKIKDIEVEEEDVSTSEVITTPFNPSDIKLTTNPMNLGDLMEMIDAGWINFGTDYQRNEDLWSNEQKSRLIESVLLGLRLPAFYFEEVSKRQWNIIDGLQRCCAIRDFCVKKEDSLQLQGLEFLEQFKGKIYADLPFAVKRDMRMLPITVNLLERDTPFEVKYILFQRLNTGGLPLTPQEVRTAMFQGRVSQTEREMASYSEFLEAICHKIDFKRQEDRDFVSRFISFYLLDFEQYQPDLEKHIREGLKKLRDGLSETEVERMKSDFRKSMRMARKIFGDDAFRKRYDQNDRRRPLNKAYFEVISTTLAKLDDDALRQLTVKKELLKENLLVLMQSDRFWNSFSVGTGNRDCVLQRFRGFRQAVDSTLSNIAIEVNDDKRH